MCACLLNTKLAYISFYTIFTGFFYAFLHPIVSTPAATRGHYCYFYSENWTLRFRVTGRTPKLYKLGLADSLFENSDRIVSICLQIELDFQCLGLEGRVIGIALLAAPHRLSSISEALRFSIGVVVERNLRYFAFVIVQFEREMRGYDRDDYGQSGDEYEDYEDDEDGEGYEEEEEDPKPTKEALAYLELRQRLKEQLRKKKSGSSLANSSNKKKKLPYDNFGSFFGPSQPVIAERVIQESKSLLETKHLTSSSTNSVHHNKKSSGSTSAVTKSVSNDQKPKVINEVKSKVQKIKDTRDYSFLLSDDAEPPAPTKDRPPQNASVSNSEVRSSQMATNNGRHIPSSNNGRHIPSSNNGRPVPSSNNGRHVPSANNGRHVPSANNGRHVPSANNGGHVPSANNGRVVPGHRDERNLVSTNGQMHSKVGPNKLSSASRRPDATSMDSRRQLGSNGGNGPGRPLETKRLPSKMPASTTERKASTPGLKNPMSGVPTKPPLSKLQSSIPRQQLQQKKEVRESNKPKVLPKQSSGLSRPQHVNKPQMQRQISSRPVSHERPPKKKPMRQHPDDDEPGLDFRSEIRKMFRQPERYASDDDDSDMEANFEDIMKEERRSALIARREDEEQARLIEEEERRERMAKQNRKRKLGH